MRLLGRKDTTPEPIDNVGVWVGMPIFHLHFADLPVAAPDELGIEFADLEHAYLEVCAAVPRLAADLLLQRIDPLASSCSISDASGQILMTVPFTDVLKPSQWQLSKARRRPHGGPRSSAARNQLALTSFRRMFGAANAGCVLLSPEMSVLEINDFGARHSHVDAEAVRGRPIFDIFSELQGEPKTVFTRFMMLAQVGASSEVVDLPYLVLDADGRTANGWWNARTWPIFDDDNRLLGLVEWAEPQIKPTRGGRTEVRVVDNPQT